MLYCDRIEISEETDVNKTSESKECDLCHYLYFLDKVFNFQLYVCNCCHDVLMMCVNLSDIAILNIEGAEYCCIINGISKNESIHLLKNADLTEKNKTLKSIKLYFHL